MNISAKWKTTISANLFHIETGLRRYIYDAGETAMNGKIYVFMKTSWDRKKHEKSYEVFPNAVIFMNYRSTIGPASYHERKICFHFI